MKIVAGLLIVGLAVGVIVTTPEGKILLAEGPKALLDKLFAKEEKEDWSREKDVEKFFGLLNEARKAKGIGQVKLHDDLMKVAQHRADVAATWGVGGHRLPGGEGMPWDTMKRMGVTLTFRGECASGYGSGGRPTIEGSYMGLLKSPEHYEIMINPNAKYVGIGIGVNDEYGPNYYLYIVFGS